MRNICNRICSNTCFTTWLNTLLLTHGETHVWTDVLTPVSHSFMLFVHICLNTDFDALGTHIIEQGRVLSGVSLSRIHWWVAFSQRPVPSIKSQLFLLDDLQSGVPAVCLKKTGILEMTTVHCTPEWWPFPVFQPWACHVTKYCFLHWPVYLCFPKLPSSKVLLMARCRIEVIFFFPS